MLLSVEGLSVGYTSVGCLSGVGLTLDKGRILTITGENGVGKSTLLKTLIGFLRPLSGRIYFTGRDITYLSTEKRVYLGMGYVAEERRVFTGMTVRENLEVASRVPSSQRQQDVEQILTYFPALGLRVKQRAWSLSGGEQQMLVIGRALMTRPCLLLLDEPVRGLSPSMGRTVLEILSSYVDKGGTIIMTSENVVPLSSELLYLTPTSITKIKDS